ncbi:hypothetical protein PFICI_00684 [Pestalotiopsis fici W106-1]|uniref:Uncharacterized protein n=1 Tax=Pestalotiopsis fici (strain W106-1 / CGMCC3.15140) TaxID=1229662 RepID=W3XNM1_PESFW|nr:uncharacterized protein PFICI_00684 [Pestalotiopsis fici W106-1]ETS86856.1 hypothetical protein PFICI_00684 [Pestalotiopsis fici W106-1]
MTSNQGSVPELHRALVVRDVNVEPKVETIPAPQVLPGTAVLRVLSAPILSYMNDLFIGNKRGYEYPLPIVPGTSAVCRVASLGPDATSLKVGQLVLFDCYIRARDAQGDGPKNFLSAITGGFSEASQKLMRDGGVRDGAFAEYVRVPLENVFVLDEQRLLGSPEQGGLGLGVHDVGDIYKLLVPFGGLTSVGLKPGETVLVSPATGPFGGAACLVALAMGARVLAWGRDEQELQNIEGKLQNINSGRFRGMIKTVKMHNEPIKDTEAIRLAAGGRPIDAYFDISPPQATGSTHFKTGILSLKHSGRVSMMGSLTDDAAVPYTFIMINDITLRGKWMYDRHDIFSLINMVELGLLKLGGDGGCSTPGIFGLEEWKKGWDLAEVKNSLGEKVIISP